MTHLREAKNTVREWIRGWDDRDLAEVYAFNADGKMDYANPCGCLIGVSSSLGALHTGYDATGFLVCDRKHYSEFSKSLDMPSLVAEAAYRSLGYQANGHDNRELRRRRMSAILRGEMRLRARAVRIPELVRA